MKLINEKIMKVSRIWKEKALFFFLISALTIAVSWSCKDTITESDIDKTIIPESGVDYQKYIQPVFNIKCTNSGCHDDQSRAGGLSLTTWTNAVSDPAIVVPFYPDNSILVWSIEGQSGANIMPPYGYQPLTENQRKGIRTWILEGAEYNPPK